MRGPGEIVAALLVACLSFPALAVNDPGESKVPEAVHFQPRLAASPYFKPVASGVVKAVADLPSRPAGLAQARAAAPGAAGPGPSVFAPNAAVPLAAISARFAAEDAGDPLSRRSELGWDFDKQAPRSRSAAPVLRAAFRDGPAPAALRKGGGASSSSFRGTKLCSFAPIFAAISIPNRFNGSWLEVLRDASLFLGMAFAWRVAVKKLTASPFGAKHPLASSLLSVGAALAAAAGWFSLMVALQGWLN